MMNPKYNGRRDITNTRYSGQWLKVNPTFRDSWVRANPWLGGSSIRVNHEYNVNRGCVRLTLSFSGSWV